MESTIVKPQPRSHHSYPQLHWGHKKVSPWCDRMFPPRYGKFGWRHHRSTVGVVRPLLLFHQHFCRTGKNLVVAVLLLVIAVDNGCGDVTMLPLLRICLSRPQSLCMTCSCISIVCFHDVGPQFLVMIVFESDDDDTLGFRVPTCLTTTSSDLSYWQNPARYDRVKWWFQVVVSCSLCWTLC